MQTRHRASAPRPQQTKTKQVSRFNSRSTSPASSAWSTSPCPCPRRPCPSLGIAPVYILSCARGHIRVARRIVASPHSHTLSIFNRDFVSFEPWARDTQQQSLARTPTSTTYPATAGSSTTTISRTTFIEADAWTAQCDCCVRVSMRLAT